MSESSPQFFKVLKGDFSLRLRIPPAFAKHIVTDPSQMAKLKGPSGRIWHVQLSRRITGTYLQDGWKTFVEDHSLKDSDFLLFRYDGMHFIVHIFDKTACEREEPITCNTREESTMGNGERKCGLAKRTAVFGQFSQHKLCKSNTKITQSDDICSPKNSPWNNVDSTPRIGHILGRQPLKLEEKADAYEKATIFSKTCKFPHFLKLIQSSCVGGMLCVPNSFRREHLIGERMTLSLMDPMGREWEVTFIISHSQRREGKGSLSGGWRAFSVANNLKVGDICIFELVGKCRLQVHIFPFEGPSSREGASKTKKANRAS